MSLVNGQLFMNALPLIPQSETTFETETAVIEFVMDLGGQVTHLVLTAAGGDNRYDRERLSGRSWSGLTVIKTSACSF